MDTLFVPIKDVTPEDINKALLNIYKTTGNLQIAITQLQSSIPALGRALISGSGAPGSGIGLNGDFYIDYTNWYIYGPKASGAWPTGVSIIGPTGATGATGATGSTGSTGAPGTNGTNGTNGTDGKTVLNGSGAPTTQGVDGDFYIDTTAMDIYGPKTSGAWGSGTSLIGPQGAQGPQGVPGAAGGEDFITKTNTDYTILDGDTYVTIAFSTGNTNRACNLPTAADNTARLLRILKSDSGTGYVTINAEGSETINGVSSIVIELQYCGLVLKCDGSNWIIFETIGECEIQTIAGAIEFVYTVVKTGTLGNTGVNAAHGVSVSASNIFSINTELLYGGSASYGPMFGYQGNTNYFYTNVDATNINIVCNGSGAWSGLNYVSSFKYYI